MSRRGTANTVPYGQACMQCFKAKCRCIKQPGSSSCERCLRLERECYPSDSIRKRHSQGIQATNSRIAELEGKVDSLVTLLQAAIQSHDASSTLLSGLAEADLMRETPHPSTAAASAVLTPSSGYPSAYPASVPSSECEESSTATSSAKVPSRPVTPAPSQAAAHGGLQRLSAIEEEQYLHTFRTLILPQFPFIYLPSSITAQQLHQHRPFLFRAIVIAVCPGVPQKLAYAAAFKQDLGQAMLLDNQSNIDLLLALLTFIAWSFDQFLNKARSNFARLMQLATSLVYELRLNQPMSQEMKDTYEVLAVAHLQHSSGEPSYGSSLENQRAVLGYFILSSFLNYYGNMDVIPWTPQMDGYLQRIEESKECPSDAVLVLQARLELLNQKVAKLREQQINAAGKTSPGSSGSPTLLPTSLYLKVLQHQLQSLRACLTPQHQPQVTISLHMDYIDMCIHATMYNAGIDASCLVAADGDGRMPDIERIQCLWRSLGTIKSWLDKFFSIPTSQYVGFSLLGWIQWTRCFSLLYRLTIYEDPVWDRQAVRNSVDLVKVLGQVTTNLEQVSRETSRERGNDLYEQIAKKLKHSIALISSKLAKPEQEQANEVFHSSTSSGEMPSSLDQMLFQPMDPLSDSWLDDIFGGQT